MANPPFSAPRGVGSFGSCEFTRHRASSLTNREDCAIVYVLAAGPAERDTPETEKGRRAVKLATLNIVVAQSTTLI